MGGAKSENPSGIEGVEARPVVVQWWSSSGPAPVHQALDVFSTCFARSGEPESAKAADGRGI